MLILAVAALCIIELAWLALYREQRRLDRAQLRQTLAELEAARAENTRLQENFPSAHELERRKREQSELLRLRDEVARLRRESKSMVQKAPRPEQNTAAPEAGAPPAPVTLYEANTRASLAPRQTLVTGGWVAPNGKRLFLFVQPQLPEEAGNVLLTTRIAEIPEDLLAKFGIDGFKSESQESSVSGKLNARQSEDLFQNLQDTPGVDLLAAPRVQTQFGRQAQVSMTHEQTFGGVSYTLGPVIGLVAERSPETGLIDLSVAARLNQASQPSSPP